MTTATGHHRNCLCRYQRHWDYSPKGGRLVLCLMYPTVRKTAGKQDNTKKYWSTDRGNGIRRELSGRVMSVSHFLDGRQGPRDDRLLPAAWENNLPGSPTNPYFPALLG
ncbi:hypothetical protein Bbelb_427030 [Branchiostoma belcheri]|nr:hypothetical protein Bbelb_427030 [Branchiostoma belcheri]